MTETESAFQIHNSDLSIRMIWHTKEERVLAHIFVCFLAYVLWKTLAQLCDKAGLGSEPRRVLEELYDIRSMDVLLPTRSFSFAAARFLTLKSHEKVACLRFNGDC